MLIDRVRVQGYRSLRDAEFRPGALTCLVGANGAGKSNLIAAFDFLKDVYRQGLGWAVEFENGFDGMAWRGKEIADSISFCVEGRVAVRDIRYPHAGTSEIVHPDDHRDDPSVLAVRHQFTLQRRSEGVFSGFSVSAEQFSIFWEKLDGGRPLLHAVRPDEGDSYEYTIGQTGEPPTPSALLDVLDNGLQSEAESFPMTRFLPVRESELAISTHELFSPAIDHFVNALSRIRRYSVVPDYCRWPGSPVPNGELSFNGGGLPIAVAVLHDKHPEAWDRVLESFVHIVPTFVDVTVQAEYDGRLALRFVEDGGGRTWLASQVSDGTLRSLALLVAIFDPRHPLILIEEPENSLHPWAIRAVVDACREATDLHGKQILLTSHSPVVIDRMKLDELALVWLEDGETRIRRLADQEPDVRGRWNAGDIDLSALIDSGWVRESVPLFSR